MPAEQNQRITVPVFHVVFDGDVTGRIELAQGVILAQLDMRESKRVQEYHGRTSGYTDDLWVAVRLRPPSHRIEIFPHADQDMGAARLEVHDRVVNVMSLLAVASRSAPAWYSEPVDKWNADDGHWERLAVFNDTGGVKPEYKYTEENDIENYLPTTMGPAWRVSVDAVEAWGRLLCLWRELPEKSPLGIAARYFYDAVIMLPRDFWRAFISASICLECILGDSSTELSYRISQRAANLGRVLDLDSGETYRHIRKTYDARSKLVHEGRHPDVHSVVDFLELLRKLLPVMAVLDSESGTHKDALIKLDSTSIGNSQIIDEIKEKSSAWAIPIIDGGPVHSPKEHRSLVKDLFPEFEIPDIEIQEGNSGTWPE